MRELGKDLRFGWRMLRKRPGAASLAIAAIALGIGLTTIMFSIVDGAFLRGLPYDHGERIVAVSRQRAGTNISFDTSPHDYADWRTAQHTFQDLAGSNWFAANVSIGGQPPERYRGTRITPNMLALLRVRPAVGRDFTDADAQGNAPPVVLISDVLWRGQFSAAPTVLGQTLRVNGVTATIVGVMPPKFGFPDTGDVWMPERLEFPAKRGEGRSLEVIGRLKDGVSLATAQADMRTIARQLADQYPENKDLTAAVEPYTYRHLGMQVITTLSTMLGAVFGVLLIACVNVTNLQLARAAERMKEMAVRFALGATAWRVVRQLLVEGLLLAFAGALLGLAIAHTGISLFNAAIAGTNPPFWLDIHIDARVLAFAAGLAVVAALASSVIPALRVVRQDVNEVLKDEGRSSTGFRVGLFSRILVVVQMTLSFVLLVVSGLMIKSVVIATSIAYPFATNLIMASISVPEASYHVTGETRQLIERVHDRLAAVPGVTGVATATSAPDGGQTSPVSIEGEPPVADGARRRTARRVSVSSDFFDIIRVRVREGRGIAVTDRASDPLVAVVSDTFVRRFFPKGDAIGRRIQIGSTGPAASAASGPRPDPPWRTIVGVVPSLIVANQPTDVTESVFVPLAQTETRDVTFFVASTAGPAVAGPSLRQAVVTVNPNLPLFNLSALSGIYEQRTWPYRVFGSLFMTFGLAALVMSAAGLYGVMSFGVRRRTQEIGVRMALGALLFHVSAWDPTVFGGTIGVLASSGLLASYVPARRAASVDPLAALRHD